MNARDSLDLARAIARDQVQITELEAENSILRTALQEILIDTATDPHERASRVFRELETAKAGE